MSWLVLSGFTANSVAQSRVTGASVVTGIQQNGQNVVVPLNGHPRNQSHQSTGQSDSAAKQQNGVYLVDLSGNVFKPPESVQKQLPEELRSGIYFLTYDPTNPEVLEILQKLNQVFFGSQPTYGSNGIPQRQQPGSVPGQTAIYPGGQPGGSGQYQPGGQSWQRSEGPEDVNNGSPRKYVMLKCQIMPD
jgi:hypothetical protein